MTGSPGAATAPRRALATRDRRWPRSLASWLAAHHVRPNAVSVASIAWAGLAAAAFVASGRVDDPGSRTALVLGAAGGIQLRLLCNMLDGLLAVEGGLRSKTGDIYNELPDRLADIVILAGAGYAVADTAYGVPLGWSAAVLAVVTAYIRALSGSLGLPQHFLGPMAKQHRMFVLTLAAVGAGVEMQLAWPPRAIAAGLALIVAGSIATAWRRSVRLLQDAEAR